MASIYDVNGNEIVISGSADEIYNYAKWNGKKLLVEGNSLTANAKSWGYWLAQDLGMSLTNKATGGGAIPRWEQTGTTTITDIKAIVNDYPNQVDLLIAQGDTNIGSWAFGSVSDQMDGDDPKTTWAAAMNYWLRCVRAKYPNIVIVLIPDSVRYGGASWQHTGGSVQPYDYGLNLNQSVQYMSDIAKYNRCLYWDFDGATPFNPNHGADNYYTTITSGTADYTHPNVEFYKAKGHALAHWCAGLTFNPDAPNTALSDWTSYI